MIFNPNLAIYPSSPKTIPGASLQLTPYGGSGGGYSWAIATNGSVGATVNPSTGAYQAGTQYGVDVVQLTDGAGNTITREVRVLDGPTLATIRTEIQQRCDLVNSNFIQPAEWNAMINASAYRLYDMLVAAYGNNYNVVEPPFLFLTDGVTQRYPLPLDFYKNLGLDVQVSNTAGAWLPIPKFNFAERDKFMVPYQVFYGIRSNLHYCISGDKIWLLPTPAAGQYIQQHYVPRMTRLVNDTDVLDGISGWEEYVKNDVAAKALAKREQDNSLFLQAKAELANDIQIIAENRDAGMPATVTDVRGEEDLGSGGWSRGPF